jgi:hypothetical protein
VSGSRCGENCAQARSLTAALMERAGELLAQPPVIEQVDVLAAELP